MNELIELARQIQELSGVLVNVLEKAGGGESGSAAPEEGAPPQGAPVPPGE